MCVCVWQRKWQTNGIRIDFMSSAVGQRWVKLAPHRRYSRNVGQFMRRHRCRHRHLHEVKVSMLTWSDKTTRIGWPRGQRPMHYCRGQICNPQSMAGHQTDCGAVYLPASEWLISIDFVAMGLWVVCCAVDVWNFIFYLFWFCIGNAECHNQIHWGLPLDPSPCAITSRAQATRTLW